MFEYIQKIFTLALAVGGVAGLYSSIKAKAYDKVKERYSQHSLVGNWADFTDDVERRSGTLFAVYAIPAFIGLLICVALTSDLPLGWSAAVIPLAAILGFYVLLYVVRRVIALFSDESMTPVISLKDLRAWFGELRNFWDVAGYLISVFQIFSITFAMLYLLATVFGIHWPTLLIWIAAGLHL